jgi:hypothetical protein
VWSAVSQLNVACSKQSLHAPLQCSIAELLTPAKIQNGKGSRRARREDEGGDGVQEQDGVDSTDDDELGVQPGTTPSGIMCTV